MGGSTQLRPGHAVAPERKRAGQPPSLPVPGDGRIRDSTLSLRRSNPGRAHGHSRELPGHPSTACPLSTRGNWNNLRQYLREWLYDGGDRARPCQTELEVSLCFAPLLRWILSWWRSGRLALAVDPTLKGDDTTAIVISVVYRGCAIPVAWRIPRANKRGSWMDPIVELLQALAPAAPSITTTVHQIG